MPTKPLRILTFSTLYPSSNRPGHGIFVETRLRELLSSGRVEAKVVAPVPWFPSRNPYWGDYARMAAVPRNEVWNGVEVHHPRYVLLPKVGMTSAPLMMALGARRCIARLIEEGFDFDLIDAHYYYPDGVAAALLARWFKKPFTVTARGTDLNLIPMYSLPRKMMQWAAARASVSIGVCQALVDVLRGWQVPGDRLAVLRNGVDLQRFQPLDQAECRRELGLSGSPLLLSVGYLIERKGHHIAIKALAELLPQYPEARLVIVGDGDERVALEGLAGQLQISDRVSFAGAKPNKELIKWYSAADVLILASSREGWANVLLEAMACGTPVVASNIWGTPEVVQDGRVGELVGEREPAAFASAIETLLARGSDRSEIRAYAEAFSWQATTDGQLRLFEGMARNSPR